MTFAKGNPPVITKAQFDDFIRVRDSGKTNMFDVATVAMLSDDLEETEVRFILSNFDWLDKKFNSEVIDEDAQAE